MDSEEDLDARGQLLSDLLDAFSRGEEHVGAVAAGAVPDVETLEHLAQAMNTLRDGIARGTLWFGWVRPTEEDVRLASALVVLARDGAPQQEVVKAARHVHRSIANPIALYGLGPSLLWLAGEPCEEEPRPGHMHDIVDRALAFFERGGDVAGFSPGPDDVSCLKRLRDLLDAEDTPERRMLAAQLWGRFPQNAVTEGIRRTTLKG